METLRVYLVSGGSGNTARHVLRACLAQFPDQDIEAVPEFSVRSSESAQRVVKQAANHHAILCHTLVDPTVRKTLSDAALAAAVPCIDILGPMLAVLGERLAQSPLGKAGLLYELHKEQFDRLDAVDFTIAHDDGQRVHDLDQAEVVLIGVSRVSKSVTCFYLAARGMRAANVPLVVGQPLPEELTALPPDKVYGLTMNAAHLAAIRHARLERLTKREVPNYADIRELNRELRQADEVFARYGWQRIDVSYKATEEVASHILDLVRSNPSKGQKQ